jgi:hypothetical protein
VTSARTAGGDLGAEQLDRLHHVAVREVAQRSGAPPMIASASGRPSAPARTTDAGVPPTAIHTGSGSCSGRG